MAPLAIIAKEAGFEVTGSDVEEEFITGNVLEKAGISPIVGVDKKHIPGVDLVIATAAHEGAENPEVKASQESGIQVLSQGEALGLFQSGKIFNRNFTGVAIAGSHGKTTTAAIVATLLFKNNLDPSFAIGTGEVPSLGSSGHLGKGEYFVAEADEYILEVEGKPTPKFLFQSPQCCRLCRPT